MPRKNTVRGDLQPGFYHIYNRGIDGRDIFADPQDYSSFLEFTRFYLEPYQEQTRPGFKPEKPSVRKHKQEMNLSGEVVMIAYCLMPDHFHLLLKQVSSQAITKLMRRVGTNYGGYFNGKYSRRGGLFESVYRSVRITDEGQLLHLTRYIHLNPVILKTSRFGPLSTVTTARPEEYQYSSYKNYLLKQALPWLNPNPVLDIFDKLGEKGTYNDFVEDRKVNSKLVLGSLVLED